MTDVQVPVPEGLRRAIDHEPRRVVPVVVAISLAAAGLLIFLVTAVDLGGESSSGWWPLLNAALNAAAAVALIQGWRHVRAGRLVEHRNAMLTALGCSTLFLVGYLVHHTLHGDTPFGGHGTVRTVYLVLLASHVVLSTLGLPFVITTAWSATTARFGLHRRIARWTLPVWLYVSATGVAVALLLTFVS